MSDAPAGWPQSVVRVGACDRGTSVRVDEEHGLPLRSLPRINPQRLGLRADGGGVQLQTKLELGQTGRLARSVRVKDGNKGFSESERQENNRGTRPSCLGSADPGKMMRTEGFFRGPSGIISLTICNGGFFFRSLKKRKNWGLRTLRALDWFVSQ